MAAAAGQGDKLNVFISYSRDDLAFAEQLYAALEAFGFGLAMDQRGISAGEDWQKRLNALIRDADTVAFVLSPSSARSEMCAWEVGEAVRLGKRILPVLCRSLEDAKAPEKLASLNYIFFYAEPKSDGSGFGSGLALLVKALNTDLDWLREHTRYLQRATEWDAGGRPANRLLSGPDIATAKAWAVRRPKNTPEPTELQLDFIKASEAEDIRQQSAEAQRLQQVAEALAERQKAQEQEADARKSEAEAQKREAAEARRVVQRTQLGLAAAVVLTVVAVVFGLVAYQQRETALRQLDRANQALAESINNDLGFMPGEPFGPRQRQALWKLAFAAEPVKSNYVSILAKSPEETVRASPGFAQISRALGLLRPSAEEAQRLIVAVVDGLQSKPQDANPLVAELKALAPKAPVSQALELLLARIGKTTDPGALRALAEGLQALAAKLTEAQAAQALESLLTKISTTTDPGALRALAQGLQALPATLTEAQATQALEPLLAQIGKTTDPAALRALDQGLQALPAKLTEAQAAQAIEPLLARIKTTDPLALRELAQGLQALAAKLTEAQAAKALESLLAEIGTTTDPAALEQLAQGLQALPAELTEAQAARALESLLTNIGHTTKSFRALARSLQALAGKLTEAQAAQALEPLLARIGKTTDPVALPALAQGLQALAGKLTEAQAARALEPLLAQIGKTTDPVALQALAQGLQALPAKLTEAQAAQALEPLLAQIGKTTDPVLVQIGKTDDPFALLALAQGLQALPAKLTEAQAAQALERLLAQIGKTTDPVALRALAQALQALPAKLTEAQAAQALEPLLAQIGKTTDPVLVHPLALLALAQGLQALAAKLTEAQAAQASSVASASLAWASQDDEAADWARAFVLALPASDRNGKLAAAIAYPAAAGPATEVLLDAIRSDRPDAPRKEAGTEVAVEWLAKTYPGVLRPPICPQPLQPDLKCPSQEKEPVPQ